MNWQNSGLKIIALFILKIYSLALTMWTLKSYGFLENIVLCLGQTNRTCKLVESRGDTTNAQTENSCVREKINLKHSFLSTSVLSDSEYI
jgi:hypothetical protein